jgi:hypothetical protein
MRGDSRLEIHRRSQQLGCLIDIAHLTVHGAQIAEATGIIRPQDERVTVSCRRLRKLSASLQHDAEGKVRIGAIRVRPQHAAVRGRSLVPARERLQRLAQTELVACFIGSGRSSLKYERDGRLRTSIL